jgi:hypothetical protein
VEIESKMGTSYEVDAEKLSNTANQEVSEPPIERLSSEQNLVPEIADEEGLHSPDKGRSESKMDVSSSDTLFETNAKKILISDLKDKILAGFEEKISGEWLKLIKKKFSEKKEITWPELKSQIPKKAKAKHFEIQNQKILESFFNE